MRGFSKLNFESNSQLKVIIFAVCALITLVFSSRKDKKAKNSKKQKSFFARTKSKANLVEAFVQAFYLRKLKKHTEQEIDTFPVKIETADIIEI